MTRLRHDCTFLYQTTWLTASWRCIYLQGLVSQVCVQVVGVYRVGLRRVFDITCSCCASGTLFHNPPSSFFHQHIKSTMSSIEDPKQLSLRTGQTSQNALGINAPPSPAYKSAPADSSVHYTCFIRLPFPRGDFVDPPQVFKIRNCVSE
jgi:hypothetical protein